jgi:hypothetical protein
VRAIVTVAIVAAARALTVAAACGEDT